MSRWYLFYAGVGPTQRLFAAHCVGVEWFEVVDAECSPQTDLGVVALEELERGSRRDPRVAVVPRGSRDCSLLGDAAADGPETLFDSRLDISSPREFLLCFLLHIN